MTAPTPDELTLERVELAFPTLLPAFEVLERRLAFDGTRVADLLARSGARVLLVSLVGEDESAAALRALDALSFARSRYELLAHYLGEDADEHELPEVVLVAPSFSTRLRARLSALLDGGDLWLVTRHELSSARGSSTRLEVVEDPGAAAGEARRVSELPAWATSEPFRGFLAQIAPDRLGLALDTLDRLRRIDPALTWEGEARHPRVTCLWSGATVCELAWVDGHLELQLGDGSTPHAIRDASAIELVLDWVLTCFLDRVEAGREGAAVDADECDPQPPLLARPPRPAPRPPVRDLAPSVDEADEAELEDLEEDEDELPRVELRPAAPGPLLTEEELQAFRD